VIAYRKGKRWGGIGSTLKPDREHGGWKFTATPAGGSHGTATGRFHC
jgi:hypothetical protein